VVPPYSSVTLLNPANAAAAAALQQALGHTDGSVAAFAASRSGRDVGVLHADAGLAAGNRGLCLPGMPRKLSPAAPGATCGTAQNANSAAAAAPASQRVPCCTSLACPEPGLPQVCPHVLAMQSAAFAGVLGSSSLGMSSLTAAAAAAASKEGSLHRAPQPLLQQHGAAHGPPLTHQLMGAPAQLCRCHTQCP
jgi:hypothetical protein